MKNINIDTVIKLLFLGAACYFLFLLTKISKNQENNSDVGRYQLKTDEEQVFDTKTGKLYHSRYPKSGEYLIPR